MNRNECVAIILAGGRGERLGALASQMAKPMITFGGDSRIIDFTLHNCNRSSIRHAGVLTQYRREELHQYIGNGSQWGFGGSSRITMLPSSPQKPFRGTADAVYQRMAYIEQLDPEYVLVLSGDHIYRMDYRKMLSFHRSAGAAVTIAATKVPLTEAHRFGIINADSRGLIHGFEEKPKMPKSNLASMGIYIFNWKWLRKYLQRDSADEKSQKDFGRNVLPTMLAAQEKLCAYVFDAYWRDVGTIQSLWEANMDLLHTPPLFTPLERPTREYAPPGRFPQMSHRASIHQSIVSQKCSVYGSVSHSVLSNRVFVSEGAQVTDSVVMANAFIGHNARIHKTIIGPGAVIGDNVVIGSERGADIYVDHKMCGPDISLVAPQTQVHAGLIFQKRSHIVASNAPQFHSISS